MKKHIYKWTGLCAVMLCLWTGAACLAGCLYPDDDIEFVEPEMMPEVGEVSVKMQNGKLLLSASYTNPGDHDVEEAGFYAYEYEYERFYDISEGDAVDCPAMLSGSGDFSAEYTYGDETHYYYFMAYIRLKGGFEICGPVTTYGRPQTAANAGSLVRNLKFTFVNGYATVALAFELNWENTQAITSLDIQFKDPDTDTWHTFRTYNTPAEDNIYAAAITDLEPNARYYFRVALNTASGEIYYSGDNDNGTRTLDFSSLSLTLKAGFTSVDVDFELPLGLEQPFQKIQVQYRRSDNSSWKVGTTFTEDMEAYSTTVSGLDMGVSYYFRVAMTKTDGSVIYSGNKTVSTQSEALYCYSYDWNNVDNNGTLNLSVTPSTFRVMGIQSAKFYIYPSGDTETSPSAVSCTATYSSSTNTFTAQKQISLTGSVVVKLVVKSTSGVTLSQTTYMLIW